MKYHDQLSQNGPTKIRSDSDELMDTSEFITSETLKKNSDVLKQKQQKTKRKSSTVESQAQSKRKISNDKSQHSRQNIQTISYTKTSDQDSTTTGRGLRPFWTESSANLSERLSYPTRIDYVGTDLNSSNSSVNNMGRKSWSRTIYKENQTIKENLPKISLPFVTSLLQETMEGEVIRARKIKLNPNKWWKKTLINWMGTSRWIYNQCLDKINNKKCKISRTELRNMIVGSHNHGQVKKRSGKKKKKRGKKRGNWNRVVDVTPPPSKTSWVLETPYEVRDSAMVSLVKAFESNFEKKKKNPQHMFKIGFRSKKDVQTIVIPGNSVHTGCILFPMLTNRRPLGCYEDFSLYGGELKIQMDMCGDFWAIVQEARRKQVKEINHEDLKVCALDPGVRTFQTIVDNLGNVSEIAPGDIGKIYRHCHHMDELQSKAFDKRIKSKRRYRLRKAWHRMIRRLKNLVEDLHRKTCKFICDRYDVVFIPIFNTKDMVKRAHRRINSKTSRSMMTWSHFKFRQMLIAKAEETGTFVKEVTEEYTSKTCTMCGNIHRSLGSSKEYKCKNCNVKLDRDENGGRNILIKSLLENEVILRYYSAPDGDSEALGPTP